MRDLKPQYRHARPLTLSGGSGERVSGRVGTGGASTRRWRTPAVIGASVVVHILVLGLLGLRAIHMDASRIPPPERLIYVEIEPRPLLENETPRPRPAPAAAAEPAPSVAEPDRTLLGVRLPFQRDRDEDDDQPTPPAPRQPAAGAPAAGTPAPPAQGWAIRPETMGDRVGRSLRTRGPGCASPQLLTDAERAICDDRFGARAAARPIEGTGDPERDARFAREGARAMQEYEARRRPLSGGVGVVGPQDGPGSNFGIGVAGAHLDPSLRPDSTSNIRTRRDGSRAAGAPLTPGASPPRD